MVKTSTGISCPECGGESSEVLDVRASINARRRRRRCRDCDHRFTTYEIIGTMTAGRLIDESEVSAMRALIDDMQSLIRGCEEKLKGAGVPKGELREPAPEETSRLRS